MSIRGLLALGLIASTPALAAQIWTGDFETGDLSQWGAQMVGADRLQIVQDPVKQGKYALKATVVQGDNPISASGNRNELFNSTPQPEGSESYYRWSTMFADDYPSEHTWQVFTQWHQPEDCCGSPPIQFGVNGEQIQLTISTSEKLVWHAPLARGVWHDFLLHVKFSDDPGVGFVELWYDGDKVLDRTYAATRANTYLKQGLYRNSSISSTGVVYHDAMVQGETLEDVLPPPPPPSPAAPASGASIGSPERPSSRPGALKNQPGFSANSGCSATGNSISTVATLLSLAFWMSRRKRAAVQRALVRPQVRPHL